MGLEPTTFGLKVRCSDQLSYGGPFMIAHRTARGDGGGDGPLDAIAERGFRPLAHVRPRSPAGGREAAYLTVNATFSRTGALVGLATPSWSVRPTVERSF